MVCPLNGKCSQLDKNWYLPLLRLFFVLMDLIALLSVHFRAKTLVPVGGEGIERVLVLSPERMTLPTDCNA